MPSNRLILCHLLLLLPFIFHSIRVFSSELVLCIRWKYYWSLSFSISPFNEYSGLISFSIYRFALLAVHGHSRFFSNTIVQKHRFLSAQFPCVPALTSILTNGETIALTRCNCIYIYKHVCTHTYVRKSFEKEYNSILNKEIKSTTIYFFQMCILAIMLGLKLYMYFMFMLIKETETCLKLVTLTADQLIYNS